MFLMVNKSKTVGNPYRMVLVGDNSFATKKLFPGMENRVQLTSCRFGGVARSTRTLRNS